MSNVKLKISVSISQLPIVGKEILDSFEKDLPTIKAKYTKYDSTFLTSCRATWKIIDSIINPVVIQGELTNLYETNRVNAYALLSDIDDLEGYLKDAKGLTVPVSTFGISALRLFLRRNKTADAVAGIKVILSLIKDSTNQPILEGQGLTTTKIKEIQDLQIALENGAIAIQVKIKQKADLVDDNNALINSFWVTLTSICDKGKRTFKGNPSKVNNYTIRQLKKKLGLLRKAADKNLLGNVTLNGAPVKGVKIAITSTSGKQKYNSTSLTDGSFSKNLSEGSYTATATYQGKTSAPIPFTIEKGKPTNLDIVLE